MRDANKLVAGIDYPRTLQEFDSFFPNEDACRKYLVQLRWPQGCQCPACDSSKSPWITARGYLHCKECRTETSITSGTIFEKIRYPLKTWFFAIWLITSQKYGASALGLKRALGLDSYQTAWSWLHKLRRAMVRPGRNRNMSIFLFISWALMDRSLETRILTLSIYSIQLDFW